MFPKRISQTHFLNCPSFTFGFGNSDFVGKMDHNKELQHISDFNLTPLPAYCTHMYLASIPELFCNLLSVWHLVKYFEQP